ncbi:TPA: peptide-methionine (R)-S-oxide reductase [Candidatus Saccharibacteria bacterium]|nr:MAG: Peptide methionine sulfoxide reductase MsrB [Candidatus Saccharibacteria bacterium GW2011_GWA2_46_10]OGL34373.1 MAG: peptide-methionine (R)-S-oxide reductase [Candidatus Saccharibacteria bacterium RIFCSPHIGHO2_12_FULL_47_17]HCM52218.1 peptide-methionine (R)-S-oxide reductase [Candidatus Saccharibacteria bacterium]
MTYKVDDEELKKKLTPEQYHVLRQKGTEAPFSGKYVNHNETGMYTCMVCGAELFSSKSKFESKEPGLAGWPSFSEVAGSKAVKLIDDNSLGMHRVEVTCANCGSHLGHLFEGIKDHPSGVHYCINSTCLGFKPESKK